MGSKAKGEENRISAILSTTKINPKNKNIKVNILEILIAKTKLCDYNQKCTNIVLQLSIMKITNITKF